MNRTVIAILLLICAWVAIGTTEAQCPKCGRFHPPCDRPVEARDGLAEVNAARAKRGLRPFVRDELLTQGAMECAKIRAARHIAGHLDNDFAHLPKGVTASAAGCGALEPSWGWGTCCTYENWTYAGAAWVMGSDGKRYMHIFVNR